MKKQTSHINNLNGKAIQISISKLKSKDIFTYSLLAKSIIWTLFIFVSSIGYAQVTDDFESETTGATTFSEGGVSFDVTNGIAIDLFVGGGSSGDKFIAKSPTNGAIGAIEMATADKVFRVLESFVYISTDPVGNNPNSGTVTFTGTLSGGGTVTHTFNVTNTSFSVNNGFTLCDFMGTPFENQELTALAMATPTNFKYFALDDFKFIPLDENSVNVGINNISSVEGLSLIHI